jgi:hypothetical protein
MSAVMWLLGLAPEVIQLIRAAVAAIREGDDEAAARAAKRAAIVHAFVIAQKAKKAAK